MALGDSYTIGTGLNDESQNFPSLLARRLTEETGIEVALVNLGVNGYTTTDLIREELPVARRVRPEFLTVLIGANDIVQGSSEGAYRTRLAEIYDAVAAMGLAGKRVLALSIPDFSGLPGAAPFGTASELRARIDAFNDVAKAEATSRGFLYEDITAFSHEDNHGDGWLAADGLHPGPAQHHAIADRVWRIAGGAVQWDRWSNPAKQVLARAKQEAETLNHSYIGTEHLLLALLKDPDSVAGKLLTRWRISYPRVRKLINRIIGKATEDKVPNTIIPTSRVRKVLRMAVRTANAPGTESVGTEHILLALMLEGDGIAAHILNDVGVTPDLIRTAINPLDDKR